MMKSTFDDNRPIFLQVKESIEEDILNGALKPDEQIPSTNQLVNFWNINPLTILKGIGILVDEEILYKKRGIGMFVSPRAQEILQQRFREAFEAEHARVLVGRAKALGISKITIHRMIDTIWKEF